MTHPIDKSNSNVTTKHSMANKNNLCGSSTVQCRSLPPDWLMNLKLGGNTAIWSTLWSSEFKWDDPREITHNHISGMIPEKSHQLLDWIPN